MTCQEVTMRIIVLIALLVSLKVADVRKSKLWNVAEGNMAVLECPLQALPDTKLNWTYPTVQDGMDQPNKQNLTGNRKIAVLTHGKYLIVLNASTFQQGDYSCSLGNDSIYTWRLAVCSALLRTTEYRHCLEETHYNQTCYPGSSCKLKCPDDLNISGLSKSINMTWHKENVLPYVPYSSETYYFSEVDEKDRGLFTCTRSYLYDGQLYKRTSTFNVSVHNSKIPDLPTIIKPQAGQVFQVDLDSKLVIDCKAVLGDDFDDLYWMNGDSFVDDNSKLTVYSNSTRETDDVPLTMTVSLIFMKVSEEHLSNPYSCILETTADLTADMKNVTISLTRKARSRILFLVQVLVPIIVVIGVASTVLYVKLRVDITLFLRDTVGCYSNSSDGKIYDAYMMCYKNNTDIGFSEEDKRWLEKVLEEEFGYNLCLYDRDVLPGEAVAESVLNRIEESRRVVLIPTYPDPGSDSGLLSAIHAALVERQTRLVLIQTKATAALQSDPQPESSLPEGLRLLANVRPAVIWRGTSSQTLSSSFWKHLRYHLPAPLQLRYMAGQPHRQGGSEGTHAYDNTMCMYLPVHNK